MRWLHCPRPQPRIASRPLGSRRLSALPRRAAGGCHCGQSAPGGGDRPGFRAAVAAGLQPVQLCLLHPGAVGRLDQEPRSRCGPAFGLGKSRLSHRSAWGSLSPADRIAKAIESSAEKRLPLPGICGGASRAGPASGVKVTATALRAGRSSTPVDSPAVGRCSCQQSSFS
ncbi:Forkhead box protein O1 [Manis javanica]|nr:Forkhead box protein O1 [Manis javanica]